MTITPAITRVEKPYPGLRPFDETDSAVFFGREEQTDALLRRLAERRLVAVVGLSGSGKSSLVRAGLIPALRTGHLPGGGHWRIALVRPTSDPISGLAHELQKLGAGESDCAYLRTSTYGLIHASRTFRKPGQSLLIILDQFEELFRLPTDAANEFVRLLLTGVRESPPELSIYVVLTMRSDRLGECAKIRDLPEALNDSQYMVPRLTRDQWREAIEGPAAMGGASVEPALLQRLMSDMGEDQDQLPVLQHLLMRMWEKKGLASTLSMQHYQDAKGWNSALNDHANEVLNALQPATRQTVAETIFRRLVLGTDSKAAARVDDLVAVTRQDATEVRMVVAHFAQPGCNFLAWTDSDTVDISHESLIRRWSKLQAFAKEESESAECYVRLAGAAERHAKQQELPWRGPTLQQALDLKPGWNRAWAVRYGHDYDLTIEFLDLSEHEAARAAAEAEEERRRLEEKKEADRRDQIATAQRFAEAAEARAVAERERAEVARDSARRTKILLIGMAVLALLAFCAALFAWDQMGKAESRRLAAQAQEALGGDVGLALKLSLQSLRRFQTMEAEVALSRVLERPLYRLMLRPSSNGVRIAAFSSDGKRIVTAGVDPIVRIWDEKTGRLLNTLSTKNGSVFNSAAFSSDGKRIATAGADGTAGIWDAATGQLLTSLPGHHDSVYGVAFSPDGKRIVTASTDRTARVWDIATGRPTAILVGHTGSLYSGVFSPDGKRIATASADRTVRIWESSTGRELARYSGHKDRVNNAMFSPDGKQLVSSSDDRTAQVLDSETARLLLVLSGHTSFVNHATFSPDGRRVITASADGTARIWDLQTGLTTSTLSGPPSSVNFADFAPDGKSIVTSAADGAVLVWDSTVGHSLATFPGHLGRVLDAEFSPDGKRIVTGSEDNTARVWDANTARVIAILAGHTGWVNHATFSPDGMRIVTAGGDATARVWEAETGRVLSTLIGHSASVAYAAFSPNGRSIFTTSEDGEARVWDANSGRMIEVWGRADSVSFAAFSLTGRWIATAGTEGSVRIGEIETGRAALVPFPYKTPVRGLAFSPSGQNIITTGGDTNVRVWDISTRRLVATLIGGAGSVNRVAFSRDGRQIVTAGGDSGDNAVRVWDAQTGRCVATLTGHTETVSSALFSADGERVFTAGWDGTARVWDVETSRPIAFLLGHHGRINHLALSPDGKRLATASDDGTAKVYIVDPTELLRWAETLIAKRIQ